jgi:hypothetical protein
MEALFVAWSLSLAAGAQPGSLYRAERKMDSQVVAAHGDDVVVLLWHQRGRNGMEMFYFDTAPVAKFLAKAQH